jgi:hypothetical protein
MICPHCQNTIREEKKYLMSADPDKPGLMDSLRGEGGEAWRIFVTVALCIVAVLVITGATAAVKHWGG